MQIGKDADAAEQMNAKAKLLLHRIRGTEIAKARTKNVDVLLADAIRFELLRPIKSGDCSRLALDYRKLTHGISRTLAEGYLDLTLGMRVDNLKEILGRLSVQLIDEVRRAIESKIPRPAINLRRNSMDEIEAAAENLRRDTDEKVRAHADKIVIAALRYGDLARVVHILRTEYGK